MKLFLLENTGVSALDFPHKLVTTFFSLFPLQFGYLIRSEQAVREEEVRKIETATFDRGKQIVPDLHFYLLKIELDRGSP